MRLLDLATWVTVLVLVLGALAVGAAVARDVRRLFAGRRQDEEPPR